jgi:hypothetical protein
MKMHHFCPGLRLGFFNPLATVLILIFFNMSFFTIFMAYNSEDMSQKVKLSVLFA